MLAPKTQKTVVAVVALVLVTLTASPAWAQTTYGDVQGVVLKYVFYILMGTLILMEVAALIKEYLPRLLSGLIGLLLLAGGIGYNAKTKAFGILDQLSAQAGELDVQKTIEVVVISIGQQFLKLHFLVRGLLDHVHPQAYYGLYAVEGLFALLFLIKIRVFKVLGFLLRRGKKKESPNHPHPPRRHCTAS